MIDIHRRQKSRAEQAFVRGLAEVGLPAVVSIETVEIEFHIAGLQWPAAEHDPLIDAVVVHVFQPLVEHPAAHPHVGDFAVVAVLVEFAAGLRLHQVVLLAGPFEDDPVAVLVVLDGWRHGLEFGREIFRPEFRRRGDVNIGVDDKVGDARLRGDFAVGVDGVCFGHGSLSCHGSHWGSLVADAIRVIGPCK